MNVETPALAPASTTTAPSNPNKGGGPPPPPLPPPPAHDDATIPSASDAAAPPAPAPIADATTDANPAPEMKTVQRGHLLLFPSTVGHNGKHTGP
jgi:hypothetical protein